jgi:hypothetical protein
MLINATDRVVLRTISKEEYRELQPMFHGSGVERKNEYYTNSQEHSKYVLERIKASLEAEKQKGKRR